MSKQTIVKVVDTVHPRTGDPDNFPAYVKVSTYEPASGEETKLILQRFLLTKIETIINRDEALALTKALLQHFSIPIDDLSIKSPTKEEKQQKMKDCKHYWTPHFEIGSEKPVGYVCSNCGVER